MAEDVSNRSIAVSTSAIEVAPDLSDVERVFISISNVSGAQCFLAIGQEATLNAGIPLSVGGTYTESKDAGFKPTRKQITAISSGVGCTLAISERIYNKGF